MAASFAVLIYFTWASDGIELARHQAPWVLFAIVAGLTVPVATAYVHEPEMEQTSKDAPLRVD
jgi:hypothetical protein